MHFHFDADEGGKLDLLEVLNAAPPGSHVFVCGPSGFLGAVTETARNAGWRADAVHQEYFGAAAVDTSRNSAFEIRIASNGKAHVQQGRDIVRVPVDNGMDVPVSCEQGVCGTCVTRVLHGTPGHRDMFFTDDERARDDQFTPCCSRSKSPLLILDL